MVVLEHDHNVDLELDFKVGSYQGGAGEQSRKDHMQRQVHSATDVTFTDLNILNFRR